MSVIMKRISQKKQKALLKVHTSNYKIVGFTESVGIDELMPIAKEHGIPVIEDLGSGVLIDLSKYGLTYEPTVQESVAKGADVVCFSGDKLFGGPQAGIIVGKKKYIDMDWKERNQLTRALRIDKFTAGLPLELVLQEYLSRGTGSSAYSGAAYDHRATGRGGAPGKKPCENDSFDRYSSEGGCGIL